MPTAKPMIVGQHQTIHLKAYAQDNAQTPSQVVDTSSTLIASSSFTTIATIAPHPTDNRAAIITAVAPGIGTIVVNESPALPSGLTISVPITAASQPDNRRVDLIGCDDPV